MASNDLEIKKNLACAYQILAYLKLDDHTYTHLSSRSQDGKHFYIYPFGFRFEEVTSDCLLKVSFNGEVVEGKEYQYNKTGYSIHGGIYQNRPEINSIFHLHTPNITAVSSMECGLLPISQWSLHFYQKVSYHDYNSLVLEMDQSKDLVKDLGKNFVMLMRNHGSVTSGETIHEAMFYSYHLEKACETQCLSMRSDAKLIIPPEDICKKSAEDLLSFEKDLGKRDWEAWIRILKKEPLQP